MVFLADMVLLGAIVALSGFAGGAFMGWLVNWRLERKFENIKNSFAGAQGVTAKREISAEKQARIAQAIAEFADLKNQGMEMKDILLQLAPKYMDLAPELMQQFGIKLNLKDMIFGR